MPSPDVSTFPDRQFLTGQERQTTTWLPDSIYSQALDALVVVCADIMPLYQGRVLLGRRQWQPQADWWVFGGRMRKGELYQVAAARNTARELFSARDESAIEPGRFQLIGVYNLIWDRRAQEPTDGGCHHVSMTMMIRLTRKEVAVISPNDEYSETKWIAPKAIIADAQSYHPCLVQMARDVQQLLVPRRLGE